MAAGSGKEKVLRFGAVGLGRAFSLMLPAFLQHPRVRLVAAADPRKEARERAARELGAAVYSDIADLCGDKSVDAVYIATPHRLHVENVRIAARHGKHILVEKPMALTLADCDEMIAAASAGGVKLMVGHSHSFDAPIARTRELVESGRYGALRMMTCMNFTDFLYRPRRPDELDTAAGGGILFNQAPHQIDVLRLIGGGKLSSVRASAGQWDRARPTEGAYAALFSFESGACATLVYSGYAHFDSDELCDWIGEGGQTKDPRQYGAARRTLAAARSGDEEERLKRQKNYGGPDYVEPFQDARRWHQHFGFVIASCETADLRPGPKGVRIYGDERVDFEACPPPEIARREVMDEFCAAVLDGGALVHDGAWGLATMEASLAILTSSREKREVLLSRQTSVRHD